MVPFICQLKGCKDLVKKLGQKLQAMVQSGFRVLVNIKGQ